MDRARVLQSIWNDHLEGMSRSQVNTVVEKFGIPKNLVQRLDDVGARKVVFGLITRLDDQALAEVPPLLNTV